MSKFNDKNYLSTNKEERKRIFLVTPYSCYSRTHREGVVKNISQYSGMCKWSYLEEGSKEQV